MDMKDKIEKAYIELLGKREIDKISVKDIMRSCDISRSTFYYYFKDVFSVTEYSMKKQMRDAVKSALQTENPEQAIYIFVTKFHENANLFGAMQHSKYRDIVEKLMTDIVREGMEKLARAWHPNSTLTYSDMDIALDFYSCSFVSYMMKLCRQGEFDSKTESGKLSRIFSGELVLFKGTE